MIIQITNATKYGVLLLRLKHILNFSVVNKNNNLSTKNIQIDLIFIFKRTYNTRTCCLRLPNWYLYTWNMHVNTIYVWPSYYIITNIIEKIDLYPTIFIDENISMFNRSFFFEILIFKRNTILFLNHNNSNR